MGAFAVLAVVAVTRQSYTSDYWELLAGERPALSTLVQVSAQTQRGELVYVVHHTGTGDHFRVNQMTHDLIRRLTGQQTMREVLDELIAVHGANAPTPVELVRVLGQLADAQMLVGNRFADLNALTEAAKPAVTRRKKARRGNWLSYRVSLLDPHALLDRLEPLSRWLFSRVGAMALASATVVSLLQLAPRWTELTANFADRALLLQSMVIAALVYPAMKVVHELAHGLALRRYGVQTRDMGVIFMFLWPVPYVEASAANRLADPRARMLVSAAGILAELAMAVIAALLWCWLSPGLARAVCFSVMTVGVLSTLLFNGNPLLRFDAYYVLVDALGLPNLMQRSGDWWRYWGRRYALGMSWTAPPALANGEKPWLIGYAAVSFVYRLSVTLGLSVLVAKTMVSVGVVMGVVSLYQVLIKPLGAVLKAWYEAVGNPLSRARAWLALGILLVALTTTAFFPVSLSTHAQGIASADENQVIRSETDGELVEWLTVPGQSVAQGQVIARLFNPSLDFGLRSMDAQIREAQARRDAAISTPERLARFEEDLSRLLVERQRLQAEFDSQLLRAGADGVLLAAVDPRANGQFIRRGQVLAYLQPVGGWAARVYIPASTVSRFDKTPQSAVMRRISNPAQGHTVQLNAIVPAADSRLPHEVLGIEGGGSMAVLPQEDGRAATLERHVELRLSLPETVRLNILHERVLVEFTHAPSGLLEWLRWSLERWGLEVFRV